MLSVMFITGSNQNIYMSELVCVRDLSLLMMSRGLEDIFISSKHVEWPLYHPLIILITPPF